MGPCGCAERGPPSGPDCRPPRGPRVGWRPGAGVSGGPPAPPPPTVAVPACSVCAHTLPPGAGLSVCPAEGPAGPAPRKNAGSESVTSFPGDMCLCGSVCVLGTGFWKLGPVAPGPHAVPRWSCFAASGCDGSEPRGPMCPVRASSCWSPGWPWGPRPGFVSGDSQPFSPCSRPRGTMACRWLCSPRCPVCSAEWPPSCRTCFRPGYSLHTTPCSKSITGERAADERTSGRPFLGADLVWTAVVTEARLD